MTDEPALEPTPADPIAGSRSPGRSRVRRRLVALVLLAGLLAGSGLFLDRVVGARVAPGLDARDPVEAGTSFSGAWFCPHGGGQGWKAWVVVTNPGSRSVQIRLTTFGSPGQTARTELALGPHRLAYRPVPASESGAATEVDVFGGWVGAATVVQSATPTGTASERCVPGPSPSWALPDGSTATGSATHLVVMNPFAQDATFNVTFFTDQRDPVRPGALTPFVLPAGTSTSIDVRGYVLQAPSETVVSAAIDVKIGRVVAGSVVTTPTGIRAEAGIARPTRHWIIPTAAGGGYVLELMNRGDRRADLSVISQDASGQRVVSGVNDLSVAGGQVRTFELPAGIHGGLSVSATNGVPFDVSLVSSNGSGESAAVSGVSRGARAWLVLPGLPPNGGSGYVALENPSSTVAHLTIELVGDHGPVVFGSLSSFDVQPGTTIVVRLAGVSGGAAVAVVATVHGGTIVASGASTVAGAAGYSSTLGVPIP